MKKLVFGLLVIAIIWAAGLLMWPVPSYLRLPASVTHGDEVLDFSFKELK